MKVLTWTLILGFGVKLISVVLPDLVAPKVPNPTGDGAPEVSTFANSVKDIFVSSSTIVNSNISWILFVLSETTAIPYAASTSVSVGLPYLPTLVAVGLPDDAISTPSADNFVSAYASVPTPR